MFHGGNFLALQIDVIKFIDINVEEKWEGMVIVSAYSVMMVMNYFIYDRFVYPFQKHIHIILNIVLIGAFEMVFVFGYRFASKKYN